MGECGADRDRRVKGRVTNPSLPLSLVREGEDRIPNEACTKGGGAEGMGQAGEKTGRIRL